MLNNVEHRSACFEVFLPSSGKVMTRFSTHIIGFDKGLHITQDIIFSLALVNRLLQW
jgi:hypothetical protein